MLTFTQLLKAKMRKIMGHWTHRAIAVPFDTWNRRIAEKKQMSSRAKNIILRMLNRCARSLSRTHERTYSATYTPLTTNPNLFHATLICPHQCCA